MVSLGKVVRDTMAVWLVTFGCIDSAPPPRFRFLLVHGLPGSMAGINWACGRRLKSVRDFREILGQEERYVRGRLQSD